MKKNKFLLIMLFFYFGIFLVSCSKNPGLNVDGIDFDLTKMNDTMAYSIANNMVNSRPKSFVGKTVKARGTYTISHYNVTNKNYHFIVIVDEVACCQVGIEFKLDPKIYNYPTKNSIIEIMGTYESYTEDSVIYYYIKVDSFKLIK